VKLCQGGHFGPKERTALGGELLAGSEQTIILLIVVWIRCTLLAAAGPVSPQKGVDPYLWEILASAPMAAVSQLSADKPCAAQ